MLYLRSKVIPPKKSFFQKKKSFFNLMYGKTIIPFALYLEAISTVATHSVRICNKRARAELAIDSTASTTQHS